MKHGLSKTPIGQHDIAKPGAVKQGSGPFTKNIGSNHNGMGNHSAAHAVGPGGKHRTHSDGSGPKGFKRGLKP